MSAGCGRIGAQEGVRLPQPPSELVRSLLGQGTPEVQALEVGEKSTVLFLATQSHAVVAKLAARETATLERRLYSEVLPRLGVAAPRLLGFAEVADRCWIVTDYVSGRHLDLSGHPDVDAMTRWVAQLHASWWVSSRIPEVLPQKDVQRSCVRTLDRLLDSLAHGQRSAGSVDLSQVNEIVQRTERTLQRLPDVWRVCLSVPPTFVHGDLAEENLFTRGDGAVVAIDWEKSGIGTPAFDMAFVDPALYCAEVAKRGIALELATASRLQLAGKVLACLSHNLAGKRLKTVISYLKRIDEALRRLDDEPAPTRTGTRGGGRTDSSERFPQ